MIVNNSDSPGLAEVIFVIECTAVNGAYINELKTNYILPTLEYFHGGALEEGGGHGSVYGIVTYQAADSLPGLPVTTYGPFTSPLNVSEAIDKLQFIGGMSESKACLTEALTAALSCFEELGRTEVVRHILLVCCSNPYTAAAGGIITPGAPATVEQAARLLGERGIHLSVAAARKAPSLLMIYEHAGGELAAAQQRNYAKDPRHLVLLRGYSLKERPPSPAPPPAPDVSSDIFGASRGAPAPAPPAVRGPTAAFTRAPPVRGNWLATRQPAIYANNSALLTQLAQPSYPPPTQPQQPNMPRMPLLGANAASNTATPVAASNAVPSSSAPVAGVPTIAAPAAGPSAQPTVPQRTFIWTGILEWMEKLKGDQQKVTKHLPCQVSVSSKDMEPELKVDAWPNKLLMQLMPKQLISNIGGQYLKDSKSVVFHLQPNEALEALTKVMVNGFAGCVHFTPMSSPPQCDIKVLILLYTPDKKAYLGFIPNNQATFVERLRKVIQQQKISQIIGKQVTGPVLPPGTLAPPGPGQAMGPGGAMGPGTAMGPNQTMAPSGSMGPTAGMGPSGAMGPSGNMGPGGTMGGVSGVGVGALAGVSTQAQGMVTPAQLSQHPQGMMMANSMGGQVGPVGPAKGQQVNQLDGLEAARQQNLEKIQHLQQTLAHQQEAQFKSQMDIMSHLQAAQQQEQHFKQLEEQQRKQQQLQHQLQQQLRGAGAHAPRGGLMRPIMPSNPGLRHLLQQQPQYRAGAARPPQPQQFDDVNGYNDFL